MKKILLVSQWFVAKDRNGVNIPGGTERYVFELAKLLKTDGFSVTVLTSTQENTKVGWDSINGITVYRFKSPVKYYGYVIDILTFLYTLKLICISNPDYVHIISSRNRFLIGALLASKILKKFTLFTITTIPDTNYRHKWVVFFDIHILNKIINYADASVVVSEEMLKVVRNIFKKKPIHLIKNPFSNCYFIELPREDHSILFVGHVNENKGIDLLLEALSNVRNRIPDVVLNICGEVDSIDYINILFKKYDLKSNIVLHGHLNDKCLKEMYSKNKIFILSSRSESALPYVVLEAMSAGMPIISFKIDSMRNELSENKIGVLIDNFDIDMLSCNIINLLTNETEWNYYHKKSIEKISFYIENNKVNIEHIYKY